MPKFIIHFKDNSSKIIYAENKDEMIKNFCQIDATRFQEEVKEIRWTEENICYIENINTGVIKSSEEDLQTKK